MTGPIYKMFYARWTEAWYQLSPEQREAIFAKMGETAERMGVKRVIVCDSSWDSDKWLFWGVEEYPDVQAIQEYTRSLAGLDWFRYVDAETLLGTQLPADDAT